MRRSSRWALRRSRHVEQSERGEHQVVRGVSEPRPEYSRKMLRMLTRVFR